MSLLSSEERVKLIQKASILAFIGNASLACIKIIFAYLSKSIAVLGDGIDSLTDVAIAIMGFIVGKIVARPGDKHHPWGHGRAETTATLVLSFLIFFAGAELALSSARSLLFYQKTEVPTSLALLASIISIAGKTVLAFMQYKLGKQSESPMILANAKNMKSDIAISAGVLVGVAGAKFFSLPSLDSIVALFVSAWVIKNAIVIFSDMNTELMDGNTDETLYKLLFDAVHSVHGASHPHRARIRKIASHWDIDLDIEVDGSMSVLSSHKIAHDVENAVRKNIPNIYDIMVHVEPRASSHENEQYGLSEKDVE